MRVWKQWTDEHRTTRETGTGHRKVKCTNVIFVNSSTPAASWIACKGAFIQDLPHGKPYTAASATGS
ncbi:hypothetical protein TNCV_3589771 [Trichonephila clavipes]|nr:hypothetical protein TNCV_3589771 [Trichonephila clavipes]